MDFQFWNRSKIPLVDSILILLEIFLEKEEWEESTEKWTASLTVSTLGSLVVL